MSDDLIFTPLAERMRPHDWQEIVGQRHLLAPGKPLQRVFVLKKPHSMIFWGPPGVGKTTLARITAKAFDCEWIAISAVFAGVKDIRQAVEQAENNLKNGRHTILFIDEIHRFNKSQQDALLPFTESGLITFLGATTENPSFEMNNALLSRAQVYTLKPLADEDLVILIHRAQEKNYIAIQFDDEAMNHLLALADGDARRLYNLLERIDNTARAEQLYQVNGKQLLEMVGPSLRRFDKNGEDFYNQISALHKSVRGSHPDAALYWFCRMLDGGLDPHYLARRIVRMAWEDIGLADVRALQIANEAASCYERLGSPEGELALAQAVIYLSVAAKSNAGYVAFNQAKAFVKKDRSREVPLHLRNAPTRLMSEIGYGSKYRYAHDEPHGYAAGENYFPEGVVEPHWYVPVMRGMEAKIADKMEFLRALDKEYKKKKSD